MEVRKLLTDTQLQAIQSMAEYWKEVSKREIQPKSLWDEELQYLAAKLGAKKILLLLAEVVE